VKGGVKTRQVPEGSCDTRLIDIGDSSFMSSHLSFWLQG
jgi:hypothetical protein